MGIVPRTWAGLRGAWRCGKRLLNTFPGGSTALHCPTGGLRAARGLSKQGRDVPAQRPMTVSRRGGSTFASHPVTEFTQDTKGRHCTIKRCTCDFRIHLRATSALTGECGISSAFFFWLWKAKFKAHGFVRIQSSNTLRETSQLWPVGTLLKGRSSIWNAKPSLIFLESK